MSNYEPVYWVTARQGRLKDKINQARVQLRNCTLCPRECGVDRTAGETGDCRTGEDAWVSGFNAHFGEEPPLVGAYGSGTIFFTHCNLNCCFCQNYDISHQGVGTEAPIGQLATTMLILQNAGCHNINLVTPSHVVPQILSALYLAIDGGLRIPLVYNTSSYDRVETLALLDGVIDLYLADFKFWDSGVSDLACGAADYPTVAREAIREMHRQVGDLVIGADGIAERGLMIRHLVMPSGLAGTAAVMDFIAREISPDTYVNVMDQYRPCGRAGSTDVFSSRPEGDAYAQAVKVARAAGIRRLAV
jgi:putative pyruvate formate lyase activating enzyme